MGLDFEAFFVLEDLGRFCTSVQVHGAYRILRIYYTYNIQTYYIYTLDIYWRHFKNNIYIYIYITIVLYCYMYSMYSMYIQLHWRARRRAFNVFI